MTEPMNPAQISIIGSFDLPKVNVRQMVWQLVTEDGNKAMRLAPIDWQPLAAHECIQNLVNANIAQAAEVAQLTAVNTGLHQAQPYTYIGKNGKSILARDLEDQRDAAEAKVAALTAALRFYGDAETYETQYERMPCDCCTDIFEPINNDKGAIARDALEESL